MDTPKDHALPDALAEDFYWLRVRHLIQKRMSYEQLPDMNAILLLIGIQESGVIQAVYTKEQKQDLMHVAICHLLSQEGYYTFVGRDADGWPHFEKSKVITIAGVEAQERLLRSCIIRYFQEDESIYGTLES